MGTRVTSILRQLGLTDNVLDLLEPESVQAEHWLDVLSHSQRHLIGLARALIANPQMLCVHKPTQQLNDASTKCVLAVLKKYVECKGLESHSSRARPRTCIMTNVSPWAAEYADVVFHV